MNVENNNHYRPGECNINPAEVAYRRKTGIIILLCFLFFVTSTVILKASPTISFITFILGFLVAITFIQVKNSFCVNYANSGVYSTADKFGETSRVNDIAQHAADTSRVRTIYRQSLILSVLLAGLHFVFLSLLG